MYMESKFNKRINLKLNAIYLFVAIFFAATISFAAYQSNNWHAPDTWIKSGNLISAQKIAENFKYLHDKVANVANIKLGAYTELGHVGGGGGGWNQILLCPPGNVVVGLNVNAGRYVDGFKVICAPIVAGSRTIQMVNDTYSWRPNPWGGCSGYCGAPGVQSRNVYCVNSNGVIVSNSFCNPSTKPATTQSCISNANTWMCNGR